jgi:hypothetical protein
VQRTITQGKRQSGLEASLQRLEIIHIRDETAHQLFTLA